MTDPADAMTEERLAEIEARGDVPDLVAEVRLLRAERDFWRRQYRQAVDSPEDVEAREIIREAAAAIRAEKHAK